MLAESRKPNLLITPYRTAITDVENASNWAGERQWHFRYTSDTVSSNKIAKLLWKKQIIRKFQLNKKFPKSLQKFFEI